MEFKEKILVTGATGFIGSYLVRKLLAEGYEKITCIKRASSDISGVKDFYDQVKWVDVDLLEPDYLSDAISGIQYVFHCAAMVSFDPSKRDEMFRINVEGTANVVNACLAESVKKLIYVSSVAALGRNPRVDVIDEDVEWTESELNNAYGKSKMLGEMEVWRGSAEGLNIIIANPSLVLGVGDWNRSSLQIFNRIHKGVRYYPSGGTGIVDVRDVADGLVKMACKEVVNERYVLSAENITFKDLFAKIAQGLKVQPPTKVIPVWVELIAPILEKIRSMILFRPPIFTRSSLKTLNHMSIYDNTKSIKNLGLEYLPIEETILSCTSTYLSSGKEP